MAANPNITLKAYGGKENESFNEFERLLRSIIGVAAIPGAQQANFLSIHLKDDALRYFNNSLDDATRANLDLSLAALRNNFCNPQLQELHKIKLEGIRFDPKKDTPENFLVTLRDMALRAYPDPEPTPVPPANPALDAGAEAARIAAADAQNAQNLLFTQTERANQIKRYFKKCMPSWLRAKFLEQPDNNTVDDLCLLARRQLTIHNLCRMDDYTEGAFNEMSSTISENLVNALSKLTQSQEAMDNKVSELSKQFEEQSQINQQNFRSSNQNSGNSYRGFSRGRGRVRGSERGYRGRNNYRGNNYRGRGYYRNNYSLPVHQQHFPVQVNQQPLQEQAVDQTVVQVTQPDPQNHIETTQYASVFCYKCGYPNHLANQCSLNSRGKRRGAGNFPFQRSTKNY